MELFEPATIGGVVLKNRVIRSATYEGMCDPHGVPTDRYYRYYASLAENGPGAVITGFAFVSREGRAMQPAQAGIDEDSKIPFYLALTSAMHRHGCPVFMQISHAGRQTTREATGSRVRGVSSRASFYFRERPEPFSTAEVYDRINDYAAAAKRAKSAGFDGVQVHAAHGYLLHQFLLPGINDRKDEFGPDPETGIGDEFLRKVVAAIRKECGAGFPVLVKISGGVAKEEQFTQSQFKALVRCLDSIEVDAIEISFGTMDQAFNIFRGDLPEELILKVNPFFRSRNPLIRAVNKTVIRTWYRPKQRPFSPMYNLEFSRIAKENTRIPVISVGGFRSVQEMQQAVQEESADFISLSRPFIAEPDLVNKMKTNPGYVSACTSCNKCAVMCDSGHPTKCYRV